MITWIVIITLAVLVAVILLVGAWAYQTANRLNRLHVRYDLSWQALDGVLARRAVVARAVAVDAYGGGPDGKRLAAWPTRPNARHGRGEKRPRTNCRRRWRSLTRPHSRWPWSPSWPTPRRGCCWPVASTTTPSATRWRCASGRQCGSCGSEEPRRCQPISRSPSVLEASSREVGLVSRRTSARIVLLDDDGPVLLFCGSDPANGDGSAPRWWFTVGGAAQRGETLPEAAVRELEEETGLQVDPADMIGPVWRRNAVIDFNGSVIRSEEMFFVHRTRRFEPSTAGRTGLERAYIHGHRWCDATMISELVAKGETVYPLQLGELLDDANALADARGGVPRRQLQSIR